MGSSFLFFLLWVKLLTSYEERFSSLLDQKASSLSGQVQKSVGHPVGIGTLR